MTAFAPLDPFVGEGHRGGTRRGQGRCADARVDGEVWGGAIDAGNAAFVRGSQTQRPVAAPVALRIVHDREGVIVRDAPPVVILEAGAGLGPRVLVPGADDVAELVAQDAAQRQVIVRIETEGRVVDEDVARIAWLVREEGDRQELALHIDRAHVEKDGLVARVAPAVFRGDVREIEIRDSLPGCSGANHVGHHQRIAAPKGRANTIGQLLALGLVPNLVQPAHAEDRELGRAGVGRGRPILDIPLPELAQELLVANGHVAVHDILSGLRVVRDGRLELLERHAGELTPGALGRVSERLVCRVRFERLGAGSRADQDGGQCRISAHRNFSSMSRCERAVGWRSRSPFQNRQ